jgi:DNA-binding NtrC family response regulator
MRSETNRPRLLLVENDRATYTALTRILTLRGWDVTVATTLKEAISAVNAATDLRAVILDLMLPDGGGEDLLAHLRAMPVEFPVAVTTGIADIDRIAQVQKLAPTVLLPKPIKLPDLLDAITPEAA